MEDAISQEYADWILSLLPQEFLKQASAIDRSSGSASLQMHHFAPLPDYISMISEDVIPLNWKARIWSGEECDSSIVQAYQAGEGGSCITQATSTHTDRDPLARRLDGLWRRRGNLVVIVYGDDEISSGG